MKTLSRFITTFTSLIGAVLSCFDRVIFKGHLALAAPCELERYVDLTLRVRAWFKPLGAKVTLFAMYSRAVPATNDVRARPSG